MVSPDRSARCISKNIGVQPDGHRIRLEISSSNFPQFDRNMNTGNPVSEDETPIVAVQHVFHDPKVGSRMILPIIPR